MQVEAFGWIESADGKQSTTPISLGLYEDECDLEELYREMQRYTVNKDDLVVVELFKVEGDAI